MAEKYTPEQAKFAKSLIKYFSRLQARIFILTKGKFFNTWPGGYPVMIVETKGAKSNKKRLIPLIYVYKNENPILVASLGGLPKNPSWFYNVKANPKVKIYSPKHNGDYEAVLLSNEERDSLWDTICSFYPSYQEYKENTDREIPVFKCVPS